MTTTPPITTIVRLEAENFKRLKGRIEIKPDGSTVVIGGKNAQGKTSVLDAIEAVLRGRNSIPSEPIHRGKTKADILLETQDIIVTRKFTAKGSASGTLEVTNKEGVKFTSPQAVLDNLFSAISFDPLAFINLGKTTPGKREQIEQLRVLVGVNTTKIDAERKKTFEDRTIQNRLIAEQEAVVARLPKEGPPRVDVSAILAKIEEAQRANQAALELENAHREAFRTAGRARGDLEEIQSEIKGIVEVSIPNCAGALTSTHKNAAASKAVLDALDKEIEGKEPIDLEPLRAALANAEKHNQDLAEKKLKAEAAANDYAEKQRVVARVEEDIAALKRTVANQNAALEEAQKRLEQLDNAAKEAEAKALEAQRIDTTPLQQQIKDAESTNQLAARVAQRDEEAKKLKDLIAVAEAMTEKIETLDNDRKGMIEKANLPVAGLGFGEDCVTFNGLPLDQASSAEQLRVGLAIACGMNPSLRVMLIRDGSLLDEDSLKLVGDMAVQHSAQVWIEKVSTGAECTVVIEDGDIRHEQQPDDQPEPAAAK